MTALRAYIRSPIAPTREHGTSDAKRMGTRESVGESEVGTTLMFTFVMRTSSMDAAPRGGAGGGEGRGEGREGGDGEEGAGERGG